MNPRLLLASTDGAGDACSVTAVTGAAGGVSAVKRPKGSRRPSQALSSTWKQPDQYGSSHVGNGEMIWNDPITIHNYTPQNSHRPAKRVGRLLSTKNHVFRVYMKIRKVTIIIPDSLRVVLVHVPLVENHLKFFIFCLPPTTSDVALDNLFAGAHKFV